jgi:hypothetical protein
MSGGRLGTWTMAAALTWLVAACAPANPDAPPQQAQDLPLLSSAANGQDRQAAADDLPGTPADVPHVTTRGALGLFACGAPHLRTSGTQDQRGRPTGAAVTP